MNQSKGLGVLALLCIARGARLTCARVLQCVLVLLAVLHVAARYALQLYEADVAGPAAYYTHLVFDVSIHRTQYTVHTLCGVLVSNSLAYPPAPPSFDDLPSKKNPVHIIT